MAIAKERQVSHGFVEKVCKMMRSGDDLAPNTRENECRGSEMSPEIRSFLDFACGAWPGASLYKYRILIGERYGEWWSIATLHRVSKQLGWSRKKTQIRPILRYTDANIKYIILLFKYTREFLLFVGNLSMEEWSRLRFIDETGIDHRSCSPSPPVTKKTSHYHPHDHPTQILHFVIACV
jgi:transposase